MNHHDNRPGSHERNKTEDGSLDTKAAARISAQDFFGQASKVRTSPWSIAAPEMSTGAWGLKMIFAGEKGEAWRGTALMTRERPNGTQFELGLHNLSSGTRDAEEADGPFRPRRHAAIV